MVFNSKEKHAPWNFRGSWCLLTRKKIQTCVFFSLCNQKIYNISLPEIRSKRCCGSFQNRRLWLWTRNWISVSGVGKNSTFITSPLSNNKTTKRDCAAGKRFVTSTYVRSPIRWWQCCGFPTWTWIFGLMQNWRWCLHWHPRRCTFGRCHISQGTLLRLRWGSSSLHSPNWRWLLSLRGKTDSRVGTSSSLFGYLAPAILWLIPCMWLLIRQSFSNMMMPAKNKLLTKRSILTFMMFLWERKRGHIMEYWKGLRRWKA